MAKFRVLPDGTRQRQVRWYTKRRKTGSRMWKKKWITVGTGKAPAA